MLSKLIANTKLKSLLITLVFYLVLVGAGLLINKISPGSAHVPGLGLIFIFIGIPIIALISFFRHLMMLSEGRSEVTYSFFLEIILLIASAVFYIVLVN